MQTMNLPHRILQLMTKGITVRDLYYNNAHVHTQFSFTHTLFSTHRRFTYSHTTKNQQLLRSDQPLLQNDRHWFFIGLPTYSSTISIEQLLSRPIRSVSFSSCFETPLNNKQSSVSAAVVVFSKKNINLEKSITPFDWYYGYSFIEHLFFVNQVQHHKQRSLLNFTNKLQFIRNIHFSSCINMGWPSEFDKDPKVIIFAIVN